MIKRVLILDDSEIVVQLTAFLIEQLGYEPIMFTKSKDVLEYIDSSENPYPNLIIADHSLTTMSDVRKTAFKMLQKLKSYGVDIPVIIASGHCSKTIIDKYMKLGVKSYVCKDEMDYIDVLSDEVKKVIDSE
jgi:CheY-like chemotaxis protein